MGVIAEALVRVRPDTHGFKGEAEGKINGALKDVAKMATGALAIGGAADFLKDSISNAAKFQEQMAGLDNTLANVGQGTDKASRTADHYGEALSKLSGFSRVEVVAALQRATVGAGNLGKAMKIETTAANLARTLHIGLAQATLLTTKAYAGNTSSMKRLGITFAPVTKAHDELAQKMKVLAAETLKATGSEKAADKVRMGALKSQDAAAKAADKIATGLKVQVQLSNRVAGGMKAYGDTTSGQIARARNALDELQMKIGTALLPVIGRFAAFSAEKIDEVVKDWPKISASVQPVVEAIKGIATTLTPAFDTVRSVIENVVAKLGGVGQTLKDVAIGIAAFVVITQTIAIATAIYEAVAAAIFLVRNAQLAMNVAMETNPIGIIVVALAALAAAFYIAYTRSATFREVVQAALGAVKVAAEAAIGWITNTGLPALIAGWNAVAPVVSKVIGVISNVVSGVVGFIQAHWSQIEPMIVNPIQAAWSQVKLEFDTAKAMIAGVINLIGDVIHGRWASAWKDLQGLAAAGINLAIGTIKNLLSALAPTVGALAEAAATRIADMIKTAPSKLAGLGGDLATAVGNAISNAADSAASAAVQIGTKIASGAISGISGLSTAIKNAVESAVRKGLSSVLPFSPIEEGAAKLIGLPIMTGTVIGVGQGAKPLSAILNLTIRRAVEGLSTTITDATKKPTAATKDAVARIGNEVAGIATAVTAQQGVIKSAFDRLTGNAFTAYDARTTELLDKVTAKWDKSGKRLTAIAQKTTDSLNTTLTAGLARLQADTDAAVATMDATLAAQLAQIGATQSVQTPAEVALAQAQDAHDSLARQATMDQALAAKDAAVKSGDSVALAAALAAIDAAQYTEKIRLLQAQATAERAVADKAAADQAAVVQGQHDAAVAAEKVSYDQRVAAQQAFFAQQIADVQTGLDAQLAANQVKQAKEQLDLNAQQTYKKGLLTDELVNLQSQLAKHPALYTQIHGKIMKMFSDDFGPGYQTAGQNLGQMFEQGLRDSFHGVSVAASSLAGEVAKYLKVKSPTEKGPMATLDTWWTALPATLAKGVDANQLAGIVGDISAPAFASGATRAGQPWNEDAFIAKLAAALGREIPATSLAVQQAQAVGATADDLARAAMR